MAKGRPSKTKGPNKLLSFAMLVAFVGVMYYQWDRIVPAVQEVLGMHGGGPTLLDADWRRIAGDGKTAVARYWVKSGRAPNNNTEAGLEEPSSYHAGALRSMEVLPGGKINFEFAASEKGPAGHVTLRPDSSQIMQDVVKWTCDTPSYKNLPECAYSAPD